MAANQNLNLKGLFEKIKEIFIKTPEEEYYEEDGHDGEEAFGQYVEAREKAFNKLFLKQPEDTWIKNKFENPFSGGLFDERLKHNFGRDTYGFGIRHPSETSKTQLVFFTEEGDTTFEIEGSADDAKRIVDGAAKHFEQKRSVDEFDMDYYITSKAACMQPEDVWTDYNNCAIISHTFEGQKKFFKLENDDNCLYFYPDEQSLQRTSLDDHYRYEIPQFGDYNDIKKMVQNTIAQFNEQDICMEKVKNHLDAQFSAFTENAQKEKEPAQDPKLAKKLLLAKKMGYVQGVCESAVSLGNETALAKKLLSDANVTRDLAQKYANPETFKKMEQGVFAQKREQQMQMQHGRSL